MAVDIATRWRDERRPETSKGSCGARRPDARLRAIAAAPGLVALSVFGAAFGERPAPAPAIALTGAVSPICKHMMRACGEDQGGRWAWTNPLSSRRGYSGDHNAISRRRGYCSVPGCCPHGSYGTQRVARCVRTIRLQGMLSIRPVGSGVPLSVYRDSGGHCNSSGPISSIGFRSLGVCAVGR